MVPRVLLETMFGEMYGCKLPNRCGIEVATVAWRCCVIRAPWIFRLALFVYTHLHSYFPSATFCPNMLGTTTVVVSSYPGSGVPRYRCCHLVSYSPHRLQHGGLGLSHTSNMTKVPFLQN